MEHLLDWLNEEVYFSMFRAMDELHGHPGNCPCEVLHPSAELLQIMAEVGLVLLLLRTTW